MQRYHINVLPTLLAAILLMHPAFTQAALSRNLRLGDTGEDVRELQQLLNRDVDTTIAQSGPGSSGQETKYFGPLTLAAVKRFQEKYATEVLHPLGIFASTGFVGERTRAKLLSLGGAPASTPAANSRLPVITAVTPSIVTATTTIVTLTGSNFSRVGNTITVTSEQNRAITGIQSADGTTLSFTYQPSFANSLLQKVAGVKYADGNKAFAKIVAQNIVEKNPTDGSTRLPFSIYVRNEFGGSAPATIFVDLAAILNGISN